MPSASDATLQEGEGPEVNESALWLHYKVVAPYLIREPEIWRQDSDETVSVEGAAEKSKVYPLTKAA